MVRPCFWPGFSCGKGGYFMLEQKIKVFSEALARVVDRRTFLRRMGGTMVAGVSAMVMGPALASAGAGAASKALASPTISCSPPGPYCNTGGGDTSGCRGGHCYQHQTAPNTVTCQVYYTYYATGCWTSAVSGGYWTCCDCRCSNNATCGCAQFNPGGNPSPH